MELLKVAILFAVTAVAEIVGRDLPWLVVKQDKSAWLPLPTALCMALFAWLLTLHPTRCNDAGALPHASVASSGIDRDHHRAHIVDPHMLAQTHQRSCIKLGQYGWAIELGTCTKLAPVINWTVAQTLLEEHRLHADECILQRARLP